ncbi:MAG TPA: hypothetical protein PKY82_15630 [Pyrinomonadaceae bacterium]|nr:hypothetical protein [Pyrinomonadaceae bacterium]
MKTIYKVRVANKKGEVKSSSYRVLDTVDNGINDGQEIEILFETVSDYVKSRSETKVQNLKTNDFAGKILSGS